MVWGNAMKKAGAYVIAIFVSRPAEHGIRKTRSTEAARKARVIALTSTLGSGKVSINFGLVANGLSRRLSFLQSL